MDNFMIPAKNMKELEERQSDSSKLQRDIIYVSNDPNVILT